MSAELTSVGAIARLERRWISPDPTTEYLQIGVRGFGRGIFHYPPTAGVDLGRLRFARVEPGDLVVSNIKAWEGAVDVAAQSEQGCIASNRFLTYQVVPERADAGFLRYFFLSEEGLRLIGRASPGSADRNRTLAIDRFEALEIPLPPIDEQHRVAGKIDALLGLRSRVGNLTARRSELLEGLRAGVSDQLFVFASSQGWPWRALGDVAEINPAPAKHLLADGERAGVAFVPMRAVDDRSGEIAAPELRSLEDVNRGYKQFQTGDVIFARITPCMQNGKSAVVRDLITTRAYGSTEFHVIRPLLEVLPEWIHRIVRSHRFRSEAASRFTGTAGQQRVAASFLEKVNIPIPSTVEEQRAVLTEHDSAVNGLRELQLRHEHQTIVADALVPAILNAAFADL